MQTIWKSNDDYDGYAPEPFDQAAYDRAISLQITVDHLKQLLGEAIAGDNVSESAGHALALIRNSALNRHKDRLSEHDRDDVLVMLNIARGNILAAVSARHNATLPLVSQIFAAAAFDATCALVVLWAEDAPWLNRPRDLVRELEQRARWLRNELHNVSIENDIRQRQAERVDLVVIELKANAVGARHG